MSASTGLTHNRSTRKRDAASPPKLTPDQLNFAADAGIIKASTYGSTADRYHTTVERLEAKTHSAAADVNRTAGIGVGKIAEGSAANVYRAVNVGVEVSAYQAAVEIYFAAAIGFEVLADRPAADIYFAAIVGFEVTPHIAAVINIELNQQVTATDTSVIANVRICRKVDNGVKESRIRRPQVKNLGSNRRGKQS